jgi:hypothetical protein
LEICKYCGTSNKSWCQCKEANDERHNNWRIKQAKKDAEAFQKAEKINYKDYNGYYLFGSTEYIKIQDDLEEWIYEKLHDGEDVPEYLWVVEGQPHFSIDLLDVISDKCEDGYDDMYSQLSTESPLLIQAQELISQWEKEQGESLYIFNENYKKAVIIKDLVEKIKEEIKSVKIN